MPLSHKPLKNYKLAHSRYASDLELQKKKVKNEEKERERLFGLSNLKLKME